MRLLTDCRTAFGHAVALPSNVLVQRLRADDESPWQEMPAPGGLTVRRFAGLVKEFDITPKNHRWEDGTQSKGYIRDDFADAWARYCPQNLPRTLPQTVPRSVPDDDPGNDADGIRG